MFGFQFLDLVIGLVFIFLLYSLAASTIREMYSNFWNLRAKNLQKWVLESLEKGGFGEKLLHHPVIQGISQKGRKPSYIPPNLFAEVFLQIVHEKDGDGKPYTAESLKKKLGETDLLPEEFKTYLLQKMEDTQGNITELKKTVEDWFDDAMMRIGGTYKKNSQRFLLYVSLILVFWTNMDTFRLINYFHTNPAAATAIADRAEEYVKDSTVIAYIKALETDTTQVKGDSIFVKMKTDYLKLNELKTEASALNLPIGWKTDPWVKQLSAYQDRDKSKITEKEAKKLRKPLLPGFLTKLAGLLISALAISLGAPFWFETLNKLVNLRGAGKDPRKKS